MKNRSIYPFYNHRRFMNRRNARYIISLRLLVLSIFTILYLSSLSTYEPNAKITQNLQHNNVYSRTLAECNPDDEGNENNPDEALSELMFNLELINNELSSALDENIAQLTNTQDQSELGATSLTTDEKSENGNHNLTRSMQMKTMQSFFRIMSSHISNFFSSSELLDNSLNALPKNVDKSKATSQWERKRTELHMKYISLNDNYSQMVNKWMANPPINSIIMYELNCYIQESNNLLANLFNTWQAIFHDDGVKKEKSDEELSSKQ